MVDTFQTEPETKLLITAKHIIRHLPWKYVVYILFCQTAFLTSIQGYCRSIGALRPSIHTLFVGSTLRYQYYIRCSRWRWPCTVCGRAQWRILCKCMLSCLSALNLSFSRDTMVLQLGKGDNWPKLNWRNWSFQSFPWKRRLWRLHECTCGIICFVAYCAHGYFSIYLVHDDAKEKEFELEMSWIGSESNNLHVHVPKDLFDEAEAEAKAALENFE